MLVTEKEQKRKKLLSELLGESSLEEKPNEKVEDESQSVDEEKIAEEILEEYPLNEIYPVYILHRVVYETIVMCKKAIPNEAIGILLGYKMQHKGKNYVKVVDWVTGKANQSQVFAEFTPEGVRQYTTLIDERYGESENRPRIVGIIHSHPFGSNPHFSGTDYNTFLNFPYDAEHNVFVLVDPKSGYYKTYMVLTNEEKQKDLIEVNWVEYTAR